MIHGDLKGVRDCLGLAPAELTFQQFNIYVDTEYDPPHALIADFGVAIVTKNLESIRPATRQDMTSPRWSAPEVLGGENPSKESDIYSFGMVMIEVHCGFYSIVRDLAHPRSALK